MDLSIILNTFVSFILFLAVHVFVFRRIAETMVIKWLLYVYYIGAVVDLIGGFFIIRPYSFVFIPLSLFLYTLLVFIYILGIFGLMESSIRIGLLTKIDQAKDHGLSLKEILRLYNKKIIVDKRLERFIASGELKYDRGYYYVNKKFSYFFINDFITKTLKKIYLK
jgi:hypothetical protein